MINKVLFTCLICSSGMRAFAQPANMDSLKNRLSALQGSKKADLLNEICRAYRSTNPDSATSFAYAANTLSQNIGYTRGMAESNRNLGLLEQHPDRAIQYYTQALSQFRSINDQRGLADVYNNLGLFYTYTNDSLALNYYDSSLKLFRLLHFEKGEGAVLNYIGIIYQNRGNFQQAIDYTLQGLDVRKKTNDHQGVIYSLINAGNMYLEGSQLESALKLYLESVSYAESHGITAFPYSVNQIGKTYLLLKQYDQAEKYLLRSDPKSGKPEGDALLLGQLYSETNRPDSALNEFKKSLAIGRDIKSADLVAASLLGLSRVYASKNQQQLALAYAKQAFSVADSLKNKRFLAEAANILEPTYEKTGDFRKALQLYKLAHFVLDSISSKTNENFQYKLASFESKSEIEKEQAHVQILSAEKALQDQKLANEKNYKVMILAGTALILLISFITIRNINQKRKKIQSQKDQIDLQKLKVEQAYEELKATQSQLMHREKMASLGELMAGIAHEIQNPLNFVSNFSEVNGELITELEEALDHGERAEALQIADNIKKNTVKVMDHSKRADGIVKGMLLHSRSSTGQKEITDINALIEEFMRLSYEGIKAKDTSFHAQINTSFDLNFSRVNIIPQDIGRVLVNLFNNAFYSVNEKMKLLGSGYEPEVSVSTRKISNIIEVRIRDNGLGNSQRKFSIKSIILFLQPNPRVREQAWAYP